jgi:deoxyribodipyrimidine photo-lyase
VYILSDWLTSHPWTGPKRQQFLCNSLASLSGNLESIGGRLVIRHGNAIDALERLLEESGATLLTFNLDPDPFGRAQEAGITDLCRKRGIEVAALHDVSLHAPGEVLTGQGTPFRVYTPYGKAWRALEKPAPVARPKTVATPPKPDSLPLPGIDHWQIKPPTTGFDIPEAEERAALKRLDHAVDKVLAGYADKRDKPAAENGTSRLSQDLRWGLLSPRTVYARAEKALQAASTARTRTGIDTFIGQLAWREFNLAILGHHPEVLETEFNAVWRGLPWQEPGPAFEAWREGRTGFPIVDAGMRELVATGHMHNRLRMITAMFLTKDLRIDWRLGEQFFMQHLLDGEIASNNGGWQWSAGTGADAAPYFRIQNPWLQGARHDPEGGYIRRWLPELHHVPTPSLMQPPKDGKPIAAGYPAPIVDHAIERKRTLAMFKKHRG